VRVNEFVRVFVRECVRVCVCLQAMKQRGGERESA
jgi:hypothetical protein